MGRSVFSWALMSVGLVACGGCASLPDMPLDARPLDAGALRVPASGADPLFSEGPWPAPDWWRGFGDPLLDEWMERALAGNPSLREALARSQAAGAAAGVAAAARSPQVSADARVSRERFSANSVYPPPLGGSIVTLAQAALNLGVELDFWGRNRMALRAALHEAQAAEAEAAAARNAIASALAQTWFDWRAACDNADIVGQALLRRQQTHDITQRRVRAGLESTLATAQSEAQVAQARQSVSHSGVAIELAAHRLAALAGLGAGDRPERRPHAAPPLSSIAVKMPLPHQLYADLLSRRPDIAARRARVQVAAERVGVARADFFPRVNLAAVVGLESLGLGRLLRGSSATPGVAPAVHLPLFDGGALRSRLLASGAEYTVAVEDYNAGLVEAMRDVADQVAVLRGVDEELRHQADVERLALDAFHLTRDRYRNGLLPYLHVLAADERLLEAQQALVALQQRRLAATVILIKALGGGYGATGSDTADADGSVPS